MDTETSIFVGITIGFTVVFIIWLIYRYYKWVYKVNDKLTSIMVKLNYKEARIDSLETRIKLLEYRIDNMSYNEEGIGSINPSEADTE